MTVLRADGELEASGSYDNKIRIVKKAIKATVKSGKPIYVFQNNGGHWNFTKSQENARRGHDPGTCETAEPIAINRDDLDALWEIGIDGEKVKSNLELDLGEYGYFYHGDIIEETAVCAEHVLDKGLNVKETKELDKVATTDPSSWCSVCS